MKKQKIIIGAIIIANLLAISSVLLYKDKIFNNTEDIKDAKLKTIEKEVLGEELYKQESAEKEKFRELKEKYASKGLVLSGDIHIENNKYVLALKNYLQASRKEPQDENIKVKIADTYFLMKKWSNAYNYYNKIKNTEIIDNKKLLFSMIYSADLSNTGSINEAIKKIEILNINTEEKFYYTNSLSCLNDFSLCKKNFADYLNKEGFTPELEELKNINKALKDYENVKIEELYYKNSLMVGAFLKNQLYPISILLGKNILLEKQNYRPILKIVAQSYFDLGDYENAKTYLTNYYEISPDDAGISYMLGIIHQKLNNYLLSNIHFTKALKLGFEDKEDIFRLQIYNAYILEDDIRIVANFNALIESQEKPEFRDLILATYYNLINNHIKKAIEFTKIGLKIYPEKEDFYGFSGWILLENKVLDKAEITLKKGFDINPKNPLINLNLARLEEEKGDYTRAKIYFNRSLKLDNGGEISKIAQIELDKLEILKKQTSSGTTN